MNTRGFLKALSPLLHWGLVPWQSLWVCFRCRDSALRLFQGNLQPKVYSSSLQTT